MLNKQGLNKIDWTDYTWNPISGRCRHNCPYCYMHRFWRFPGQGSLQLKEAYLADRFPSKPSKIFVGSSTDIWGDWVPTTWIDQVLSVVRQHPQHTFQFLTKNPFRYTDFDLPIDNAWYGTTVDGTGKTESNLTDLMLATSHHCRFKRYVSFEPLMAPVKPDLFGIQWVIIGADSNRGAQRPPNAWADILLKAGWYSGCSVWVKDNYGYHHRIKEWPSNNRLYRINR